MGDRERFHVPEIRDSVVPVSKGGRGRGGVPRESVFATRS